ncbi:MAG: flagellar hook-basal body complex protein [Clostridia bacterium]|nr:flagellar hook-basal body complex protein [Clostridia bacterium]
MLRSMYSGITGLKNHQIKMDVVGNNIANVNTIGFKSSRVTFQDIYSQTVRPAAAPNAGAGTGGTNPLQIGLGMTLGSIDVLHTNSATEYTGSSLDLSLDGDGFFVVNNGDQNLFTRAGNFYMDRDNNLVTASGMYVLGWSRPEPTDPPTPVVVPDSPPDPMQTIQFSPDYYDISISKNGEVIGINETTQEKEIIAKIALATFSNQSALQKMGESVYAQNLNSGAPQYVFPGSSGAALVNPSSLEMSNVDLAKEFTDMIVTQRGFQANSRVITTSDQLLEELVNLKR